MSVKSLAYSFFRLLPVKQNRVLFISYYGKSYGCNPKYISEYLADKYGNNLDICWALNDVGKYPALECRKVRYASLAYLYLLATARIVCTNYRMTADFCKRSSQVYFQTWHSSLRLKMIEADTEETLPQHYVDMARHDSAQTDYVIAGCEKSAGTFANSFWYSGRILPVGTPRNDLLLANNPAQRDMVKSELGVEADKRIALYAPTFREDKKLHYYDIDFDALRGSLSQRFGGEWVVVRRLHPHLSSLALSGGSDIIEATDYDDIQELLLAADVLITDYSSLMFDFAVTGRPVFLYANDFENYCAKERKLYFHIEELPFPLAKTGEELKAAVENFSEESYHNQLERFNGSVGTYESGNASEKVGELMANIMKL